MLVDTGVGVLIKSGAEAGGDGAPNDIQSRYSASHTASTWQSLGSGGAGPKPSKETNHVETKNPPLTVQTLNNRVEALRLHNGEELQRWAARPFLAALPFADKFRLHVQIVRKHALADPYALADSKDFLGR
jgi:hypothetical protein